MHLAYEQVKRFYRILDSLIVFANEALQVTDSLLDPRTHELRHAERNEVMEELWDNRDVIDAFISANSAGLGVADLHVAHSWKTAIHDTFVLAEHCRDYSVFLGSYDAFAVKGLAQNIDELIPKTPTMVKAALVPFEGCVVFASTIAEMPISFSDSFSKMIEDNLSRAHEKGLVTTADQFAQAYQTQIQEEGRQEIDRLLEELEDATGERPEKSLPDGFHRSPLADLDFAERQAAIDAAFEVDFAEASASFLERNVTKGEPTQILAEALNRLDKDDLLDLDLGGTRSEFSHLRKAELVARAVDTLPQSLDVLMNALETCTDVQHKTLRALFEAGGSIVQQEQETLEDLRKLLPLEPFSFLFANESGMTLAIPDELLPLFQQVDWAAVDVARDLARRIADCAETYVELCGVASVGDVYEQFCAWYPESTSENEFFLRLFIAQLTSDCSFEFLDKDGTDYLVHYLLWTDLENDDDEIRESAQDFLNYLLEKRADTPLRTCDEELRKLGFEQWLRTRPQIRALQQFLDGHIPDGEDDLIFADEILDNIIEMRMCACPMSGIVEYLEHMGLLADDSMANDLLQLLNVTLNVVPLWENRGWSAMEVLEQTTGKKLFYNPDGSLQKIGRNDPCPCGSGKKYKKCCG